MVGYGYINKYTQGRKRPLTYTHANIHNPYLDEGVDVALAVLLQARGAVPGGLVVAGAV